jgi:coproporphyrinogen III oxidase-like Fe-S oxidoreductase
MIEGLLADHGYAHYETSAFAQPAGESRHNSNYWLFGDYLGIGAGAHSKISFADCVTRQVRCKHPREYLERVAAGEPVQQENTVTIADLPFEFMMNALRLTRGFPARLFEERTGLPLLTVKRELEEAERRGLLARTHKDIAPTLRGQRFLNDLLQLFLREA